MIKSTISVINNESNVSALQQFITNTHILIPTQIGLTIVGIGCYSYLAYQMFKKSTLEKDIEPTTLKLK